MDWHVLAFTCAFIAMDLASGFIQAVANKCVDSGKMRTGLWHKCGFIGAILLSALCEWATMYIDLGFVLPLFTPVCVFICLTEIVSIFENLCEFSPELANSKLAEIFNITVE